MKKTGFVDKGYCLRPIKGATTCSTLFITIQPACHCLDLSVSQTKLFKPVDLTGLEKGESVKGGESPLLIPQSLRHVLGHTPRPPIDHNDTDRSKFFVWKRLEVFDAGKINLWFGFRFQISLILLFTISRICPDPSI